MSRPFTSSYWKSIVKKEVMRMPMDPAEQMPMDPVQAKQRALQLREPEVVGWQKLTLTKARPVLAIRSHRRLASPSDQFRPRTIRLHPDIRPVSDRPLRLQMRATSRPAAAPSFPAVRLLGTEAVESVRYLTH